jgi:hypothetical protein
VVAVPPISRDFGSPVPPHSPSPIPTGEEDREVFEAMGDNLLSCRFEINVVKVGCFFSSFDVHELTDSVVCFPPGSVVALTWDSVPSSRWGWMAISNAC